MKKNILVSVHAEQLSKLSTIFPEEENKAVLCEKAIHYYLKDYEEKYGKIEYFEFDNQEYPQEENDIVLDNITEEAISELEMLDK